MSKIPVLLLVSRTIDLNVLNHSPRFENYHFFSLTALDYLENDPFEHKAQTLWNALHSEIERLGAHYLLAHLGLAFDRYPVEFLTAVLDIHSHHPQLKIGFDRGLHFAIRYLKIFPSPGPEVHSLVARLTRHRLALDREDETALLAACLY